MFPLVYWKCSVQSINYKLLVLGTKTVGERVQDCVKELEAVRAE